MQSDAIANSRLQDLNATDRGVSAKLIDYWQTFAATGTPNAAGCGNFDIVLTQHSDTSLWCIGKVVW